MTTVEADRPVRNEIEITPEMMEEGLRHLYRYHPDRGVDAEDTVRNLYLSMTALRERLS